MSANKGLSSRAIIGSFYNRLEVMQAASWVDQLGMRFQSDQESETYKWLGMSPPMREFTTGRQPKGLRENGLTIVNKTFESTMEIPVDWIRRDKTGQIMARVGEMATRAVTHWQSLMSTLILNGESTPGYDEQFFFDTDHSEGASGTQSNDLSVDISAVPATLHGTTTDPSPEEVRAMVLQATQAILGFKDDVGEPMNEMARQFLVMVPTTWFSAAAAALNNPVVGAGDTNVMTNLDGYTFGLAVNPRLTWTTKLAVFRTDGQVKPFILQEEEGITVQALAEGSAEEIMNRRHLYGVTAIRNVGYGYWQHACLATAA